MDCYILDTNVFFNMESGFALGKTTDEVIRTITTIAEQGKKTATLAFYMPPRIVEEFLSFFENKDQPHIQKMLSLITVQSPDVHAAQLPAQMFYTLVDDIRQRSYRGLRVGEEEITAAGKTLMEKGTLDKITFQKTIGEYVKGYRERYRQATRVGFLDSVGDLDIIMLAKELSGTVVTSDEGLLKWARLFGVKEVPSQVFAARLHQE